MNPLRKPVRSLPLAPSLAILAFALLAATSHAEEAPLRILSPSQDGSVAQQTLNLEYSFDPSVFGKSPEVDVKIDGLDATVTRGMMVKGTAPAPAAEADSSPSRVADTKNIQIPPQDCEVSIVAIALDGTTHTATVRVKWTGAAAKVKKEGRLLVLAIGVSQYQDETIQDLQLAAKDARDFAELVATQEGGIYTDAEVRALVDSEATRGNILDALEWLEDSVKGEDTAMIFLAGHGMSEDKQFYFVPHDADDEKIRRSCVGFDDVQTTATGLPSRTIVFLDACHSGGIGGGGAVSTEISAILAGWQKADSPNGAVIYASSTGDQLSQENIEWMNGAFTKALLEGLKGHAHPAKAGPISVSLLENYVSRRVKELTADQQTPTTTRSMDMTDFDFYLAGDAKLEKARLEKEAFEKEAQERAINAVRTAFIAQQYLIQRQNKIKELEDLNSDGLFDEKISTFKNEVTEKSGEISQNLAVLEEISAKNKYIVASALAQREKELSAALKTADEDVAEVAVSAMNTLKQQIKIPE